MTEDQKEHAARKLPTRVMLRDLGPGLVLKWLGSDTCIVAYAVAGHVEYDVKPTEAILGLMEWPPCLLPLEVRTLGDIPARWEPPALPAD